MRRVARATTVTISAATLLVGVLAAVPAMPAAAAPTKGSGEADVSLTGISDGDGYHVYVATAANGSVWRPLATLSPGGGGGQRWIGRQCLTGDGRTAVVLVAPWQAANSESGMNRGGLVYAVDLGSGAATPLAAGVSLAYFNPGCGIGGQITLTSYLGPQQRPTRVTVMDVGRGRVLSSVTVPDEVTSAVAAGGRILAARGAALVELTGAGIRPVARMPGQVTQIREATDGGVDLVAALDRNTSEIAHVAGEGIRVLATGARDRVTLVPDGDGGPIAANSSVVAPGAGSLTGLGRLTRSTPKLNLAAAVPAVGAMAQTLSAANTSTPACAVPRNDQFKQVWQPSSDQVRWAVNQAVQGFLKQPYTSVARPVGNANYTLDDTIYQPLPRQFPDVDFALVPGAPAVPPLVMYGILAQESNFNQASWHAVPGRSGNPLIANYYGTTVVSGIDYDEADCGYGIAQITDGMRATGTLPSAQQVRVAVDYATNIAAAVRVLQTKWLQLHQLGVTLNNDDPTKVENWYAAIWAYNSGVHTDPTDRQGLGWFNNPANPIYPDRHAFLHSGIAQTYQDAAYPALWPYQERVFGWIDVPQVDRNGLLEYRGTYDWDTGRGTFLNTPPAPLFCRPEVNSCDPVIVGNHDLQPCPSVDSQCWWNSPATWTNCSASCVTDTPTNAPNGHVYHATPGDPEPAKQYETRTCQPASPGTAAVVVDELTSVPSRNPDRRMPNLMGCAIAGPGLIPPASAQGSFTITDGAGRDVLTDPAAGAAIDLHQLGGGAGGHLYFTHTRSPGDVDNDPVGHWSAQLSANTTYGTAYEIKVFVPDLAAAGRANYDIEITGSAAGAHQRRSINQARYGNQWVSLGYYVCGGPSIGAPSGPASCTMTVSLHSVVDGGATEDEDIAYDAVAFVPVPTGQYVALGDSYSSGEGVGGGFDDGTDYEGSRTNLCHRSADSWPRILARSKVLPLIEVACSGSNLGDVVGTQYYLSQQVNPGLLPYTGILTITGNGSVSATAPATDAVSSLPNPDAAGSAYYGEPATQLALLRALQPRLVTVTAGGNDIGFADIVMTCINYAAASCKDHFAAAGSTLDQIDNRIDSLQPFLAGAFGAIAAAAGGADKVTVVTYPAAVSSSGAAIDCSLVNQADRAWLVPKVSRLSTVLIHAAAASGVHLIDLRDLFDSHEACSQVPYVTSPPSQLAYPLTASTFDNWLHPNRDGYAAMAGAIGAQIVIP